MYIYIYVYICIYIVNGIFSVFTLFHVNLSRHTVNNRRNGFPYSDSHNVMFSSFNNVIVCRFSIGLYGNLLLPSVNRGYKA